MGFIGKPPSQRDAVLHAGGVAEEWIDLFSGGVAGEVDDEGQSSGLACQTGGPVEQGFVDLGLAESEVGHEHVDVITRCRGECDTTGARGARHNLGEGELTSRLLIASPEARPTEEGFASVVNNLERERN